MFHLKRRRRILAFLKELTASAFFRLVKKNQNGADCSLTFPGGWWRLYSPSLSPPCPCPSNFQIIFFIIAHYSQGWGYSNYRESWAEIEYPDLRYFSCYWKDGCIKVRLVPSELMLLKFVETLLSYDMFDVILTVLYWFLCGWWINQQYQLQSIYYYEHLNLNRLEKSIKIGGDYPGY